MVLNYKNTNNTFKRKALISGVFLLAALVSIFPFYTVVASASVFVDAGTDADAAAAVGSDALPDKNERAVSPVFNDISDSWARDYIERAYEMGLVEGYGDGSFGPEDYLTRAQMAQLLWNNAGRPESEAEAGFTDLSDDWYRSAVAWVTEQGIFKGYGDGRFVPDGYLTREQALQVLFNMSGGKSGMESLFKDIYDSNFKDMNDVSEWAKPAVYWSVFQEVLCGTDSDNAGAILNPASPADRAQIAVMLVKYKNSYPL